jgi:hypothetical protein
LVGFQNFVAALSVLPLIGMLLEQSSFPTQLIHIPHVRDDIVLLARGVLAGNLLVAAARVGALRVRAVIPPS